MQVKRLPYAASFTYSDIERIFKELYLYFPEEIYHTLLALDYDVTYAFSCIQKGMDRAYAVYNERRIAYIDSICPFNAT